MEAFITRRGGAGSGLNFSVVGGTTQPSNPKENTIWVNTETEITGWSFSATEPTEPIEGMVWISTAASGNVKLDLLMENTAEVYLVRANQYVSGSWALKAAMRYVDGEWSDLVTGLIYKNDRCADFTGGWSIIQKKVTAAGLSVAPTLTVNSDSIKVTWAKNSDGIYVTNKKISLADFKTLRFIGDIRQGGNEVWFRLIVWSALGTYWGDNFSAQRSFTGIGSFNVSVNVSSLTGSYYIGFGNYTGTSTLSSEHVIIKHLYLE